MIARNVKIVFATVNSLYVYQVQSSL